MLNFDVKYSFMCIMSNVYGNFKMADAKPNLDSRYCNYMSGNFPLQMTQSRDVWCLKIIQDNVNVYSLFLPCQQIMCRIYNYRSKRLIYF